MNTKPISELTPPQLYVEAARRVLNPEAAEAYARGDYSGLDSPDHELIASEVLILLADSLPSEP